MFSASATADINHRSWAKKLPRWRRAGFSTGAFSDVFRLR
jgi:hypothetical protein